MTRRGFLGFDWSGDGVVGLGPGLGGPGLGLVLSVDSVLFCLERIVEGEGDGYVVLEKKAVI